jgi:predicted phage replisome organizer/uncharacterized phage protein (TIGR02220 family)
LADVKWIKIVTDIFDDEKILLIESMPEADSIIVLWFKLLCLAGKQNNSGVFVMSNGIPYTEPMLATIFRRKETVVALALRTFEQFGMIEIVDNTVTIPRWGKHQSLDKIESKNEYQRQYMKDYRARQKQLAQGESECKPNGKTNCKANVSSLEGEEEREGDLGRDKRENVLCPASRTQHDTISEIVAFLNSTLGSCYKSNSKKTATHIIARLREGFTVDNFKTVILKKCAEWSADSKMSAYLRPETLFGTKFEGYLNQPDKALNNSFLDIARREGMES